MNAQRTQPRWQTTEQMPQQMVGQTHWYPNAQAQASMDNVYVNPNANDVQMSVKPPKEIRSGEVKNLRVVTQDEFNLFVDGMLHKDYTNMPNIVKVESFNNELKEALGIPNADFYITKKHISHIREERKAKYNQALRPEEIKNIPQIIRETRVAYIDKANHNFFVAFPDVQDSNRLNFIHFNADENGNYMVTAKKAHKDTVNSSGIEKQYQLVQAGAAPAIPNPSNSDLPLTNFEVSNTNQLSNSTPHPLNNPLENPEYSINSMQSPLLHGVAEAINNTVGPTRLIATPASQARNDAVRGQARNDTMRAQNGNAHTFARNIAHNAATNTLAGTAGGIANVALDDSDDALAKKFA
ncbi:MAG: hypothetical protein K2N54_06985, partial [Helicobacter sp.]|nr:hypothetical protein [Helicobacter sp.]